MPCLVRNVGCPIEIQSTRGGWYSFAPSLKKAHPLAEAYGANLLICVTQGPGALEDFGFTYIATVLFHEVREVESRMSITATSGLSPLMYRVLRRCALLPSFPTRLDGMLPFLADGEGKVEVFIRKWTATVTLCTAIWTSGTF
ncbi:hypothetical protein BDBG_03375 [Blastomyces gilchristii SLH14081]|uniref:Uncharacterized protein n=1 Tax=Blastomyces gilchristii (strain SLH14081) TaxID=559298 RepID=A0A179UHG6_BLAGS|nr:uncharacterized protein BDBG_03375 [Blastomyces gilchristii SLH14081]OAT07300.1 hypothetical protein BDBG_03375 [Blastomyces gilchristii SLH14081]